MKSGEGNMRVTRGVNPMRVADTYLRTYLASQYGALADGWSPSQLLSLEESRQRTMVQEAAEEEEEAKGWNSMILTIWRQQTGTAKKWQPLADLRFSARCFRSVGFLCGEDQKRK